jgi:hypothetical protein
MGERNGLSRRGVLGAGAAAGADTPNLPLLQPLLTVVGGQIVHDTGDLTHHRQ